MTAREKELLAQQAEGHGWFDTARTVRAYCATGPYTRADVLRTHELAAAFGWTRLPGWKLLQPPLRLKARDRT